MFKIANPKINNIKDIKYEDIIDKSTLDGYYIKDEEIILMSDTTVNNSKFEGVTFKGDNILNLTLDDVIFINCDLSNIKFIDLNAYRVEFINCKLVGTNFINSSIFDISIKSSLSSYINISGTNIKKYGNRIIKFNRGKYDRY